jgi:hypothetical protein
MSQMVVDSSTLILLAKSSVLQTVCDLFDVVVPKAVNIEVALDKEDRLLLKYVRKELGQMEVCKELKWDPWQFLTHLKARNLYLNVELEDWLDAAKLAL